MKTIISTKRSIFFSLLCSVMSFSTFLMSCGKVDKSNEESQFINSSDLSNDDSVISNNSTQHNDESSSINISDDESTTDISSVDDNWIDSDGKFMIYPVPKEFKLKQKKNYEFKAKYHFDNKLEDNAAAKMINVLSKHFAPEEEIEGKADLVMRYDDTLPKEGYTIDVDNDGITIKYKDGAGAYYSAVTLDQIFANSRDNFIPYISIDDHPDVSLRGFHISSQDKVGKIETYKAIIDELAALKMNLLELAVFRPSSIQIDTFSSITQYETGLTVEDCQEITAYAAKNYIEVVPYMETFGHMDELLRYPQFSDMRNTFTAGCATLSIFDEKVHQFLENYADDMISCFNPRFLTIGGDEVSGILGGKNQQNAPEGSTEASVFIYYLDLMYDICTRRNVDMYCCYDVIDKLYSQARKPLKEMFERMPRLKIIVWQYEEDSTFVDACDRLERLGAQYVIMPSTNTFGSCSGRLSTAEKNISIGTRVAIDRNTDGVITAMYGDGGTRNTWVTEINAVAYAGGCCWNYSDNAKKYSLAYDYVNDYIFGGPTRKLQDAWEALQRHNDILGRSWGLAWLTGIGNQGYISNSMLDLYLSLQKGDDIYNQSVEKMNRIIALANDVLNTLDEVTLNGKYSDAIRSEMTITSRQMVALASYTKMLLQLQGELKTKEELKEEATLMYDYMLENDELYRETWLKVNRHGVLEDSINWLNIPMGLFLQLGDSVKPKNDNLFYITPDTIDVLDEKLFSKGFLWANYGKNYPTISITNGIYSPNDIIGLIDEGSLTLLNDMLGIQGKVLAIDGDSLMENNRYQFFYSEQSPTSKMKPVLYFPCVLDGNGTYQMTAKIKFKNNSPINGNVLVSTMVSDGVIHSLNGNVSFSNADENGWITVTYEFNNDEDYRYACIGINSKPEMYTDTFYVGELLLIKK